MKNTVIALCLSLGLALPAAAQQGGDREKIEKIVEEYIMAHPEVIERSMKAHYEKMRLEAMEKEFTDSFANRQTVSVEGSPILGDESAKITIVEFSDFQCPYCAVSVQSIKQVREKYGAQVRIAYRHFPLPNHPGAIPAAKASLAAEKQGKFWAYHDLLMRRQEEWGKAPEPVKTFVEYARSLGLDAERFKRDLADPEFESIINRDLNLGKTLRIQATPTFFVNGVQVRGAVKLDYFSKVIDKLLAEK